LASVVGVVQGFLRGGVGRARAWRNDPDRLLLRKYSPVVRRHVHLREER
jgi:hypothetical protein